ncbi:MAG: NAD-dependent protein deacetylase [Proteobacteria bacterium]|nr:NAD-dependent protein deacetylase [Pseudomonadota bacterium]
MNPADATALRKFLDRRRIVVLTGAGISAGSGIPTYRDENGTWLRSEPITHQDFIARVSARQRYWLRSYSGWPAVARAAPSPAHHAVSQLEADGIVALTVTQNVDRLHQKAGSRQVIDLHGRLDRVICLACRQASDRTHIQERLLKLNPALHCGSTNDAAMAPDGDADVSDDLASGMVLPACLGCGGTLKPDVVFFGDTVERAVVDEIYNAIAASNGLLVVGSSLKVFSGYRFCRHAAKLDVPIASINPGVTRADPLLNLSIRAPADAVLAAVTAL